MAFPCNIPTSLTPPNAQNAIQTGGGGPVNNPYDIQPGQSRDSDEFLRLACVDAFDAAWDDWLNAPTIIPETQPTAGLVSAAIQAGPNVLSFVGSLSTSYQLDFFAAVPGSKWNEVESIELDMPWTNEDDLSPWFLELWFMGTPIQLVPGTAQVFLPLPSFNPGLQTLNILPNTAQPAAPCPPDQILQDTTDGIDTATLNMADELLPTVNTSPTPFATPFVVNMIGKSGGTPVVSPPLPVI